MIDEAKIRAAFKTHASRMAFLWNYADPILDRYAHKPEDAAKAADYYCDKADFFADLMEKMHRSSMDFAREVREALGDSPDPDCWWPGTVEEEPPPPPPEDVDVLLKRRA
jgi:hypothetical protein